MSSTTYSNLATLQNAIYDWLDPLSTERLIWVRQRAPQPSNAFLALNLTSLAVKEGAGYEKTISGSTRTLVARRRCTLNVQSFGENAVERLFDLQADIFSESSLESLRSFNIGLLDVLDITDVSQLLETEFQERASMDIILGYTKNVSDGNNYIEILNATDPLGDDFTVDGSS